MLQIALALNDTPLDEEFAVMMAWLSRLGQALMKGKRRDFKLLKNGRARITIEYPTLADLIVTVQELDAIRAMSCEDGGQSPAEVRRLDSAHLSSELREVVLRYHMSETD